MNLKESATEEHLKEMTAASASGSDCGADASFGGDCGEDASLGDRRRSRSCSKLRSKLENEIIYLNLIKNTFGIFN